MTDPRLSGTRTSGLHTSIGPRAVRTLGAGLAAVVSISSVVPTAAAHDGGAQSGVPHWTFLLITFVGLGTIAGAVLLGRTRWQVHPRRVVVGVLVGVVIAMIGAVGTIELQLEPTATSPVGRRWYPVLTGVAGAGVTTGSLLGGRLRWPDRPQYAILGMALGVWILYPVLFPGPSYHNPVGYATVLSVPALVGYIVWRDVHQAVALDEVDRFSVLVGATVTALFGIFFWFSSGLLSTSPDGVSAQTEGFVAIESFANPLVIWPAVEFYVPSISLGGAVSVGTGLVTGLLAGLVGVNAALLVTTWERDAEITSSNGALGAVMATGATACGCCGPAVYAIASAVLGATASPLYWAFLDPVSPAGSLFLAGAVLLLTGSGIRLAAQVDRGACPSVATDQ